MNTFKRKSLHAAVLAGLGAVGMAGTAEAVHVSPDGVGSVLVYPYYTVRGEGASATTTSTAYYDTYVSIVNTTNSTKAVKVRFLEGKRSAEVLDFNLYLSPFDVWTGAIVNTAEGAGLISVDNSCTSPRALFPVAASGARATPTIPVATDLNHFKNFVYATGTADGGGTSLDRTREGYVEVFEMGDVTNTTATAAAKHNSAGIPANCAYFDANDLVMGAQLSAPTGGLMGAGTLINVPAGVDYSYSAVALANWSNAVNYSDAGNLVPRLTNGSVTSSTIFTASGNVVTSFWSTSRDAVTAALTTQSVLNEWVLESGTSSGTDWVVTFPTKFAYVGVSAAASPAPAASATAYLNGNPFNQNFSGGVSCDGFSFLAWNREEAPVTPPPTNVCPSPTPPAGCNVIPTFAFCYEANILTYAGSQNLGSKNIASVDPTTVGRNGWARVTFDQNTTTQPQHLVPNASFVNNLSVVPQMHRGLPAVGFMVQDFTNRNVAGVGAGFSSLYGGDYVHKYFRSIGTTP